MPQTQRKPRKDELPRAEYEVISIDRLKRDEKNVRDINPPSDLLADIESEGFVSPLIGRKDPNSDKILITDGNQRLKAGKELGYTHIPVYICKNSDEATRLAESHSRNTEWKDPGEFKQDAWRVKEHQKKGLSKTKAIEAREEECHKSASTIERNIKIAKLPEDILELLRDPGDRREGFHEEKRNVGTIKPKHGKLTKRNAEEIAGRYNKNLITGGDAFKIAKRAVKHSDTRVVKESLDRVAFDDKHPKKAFEEALDEIASEDNGDKPGYVDLGHIKICEGDEKKFIDRYLGKRRTTARMYFRQMIKDEAEKIIEKASNNEEFHSEKWASGYLKEQT